jgi:predicted nuclease with TOPRIM domain
MVQRVGKLKAGNGKLPAIAGFEWKFADLERLDAAPSVPLIARDAFVADMAIKLDQTQLETRALARELDAAKKSIAEIREDADRNYRFASFQDNEQRARAQKLDEISRRFKHLKERVDAIDGKSKGDYQSFESLEAISKRVTELTTLQRQFRDVSRKLKYCAGLFCGSVLLWLATFLSS